MVLDAGIWRYKDIVSNSLDVLSFVLVTPELVRYAKPLVRVSTRLIIGSALLGLAVFGLCIPWLIIQYGGEKNVFPLVVAVPSMMIFLGLLSYLVQQMGKPDEIPERTAKQSFLIGVVIFLISRVFAFTASLAELVK